MSRRKLPTHIDVSVWCFDDGVAEGERVFATVTVPVLDCYRIPTSAKPALWAELSYDPNEVDTSGWGFEPVEPSMWIVPGDVDAHLASLTSKR